MECVAPEKIKYTEYCVLFLEQMSNGTVRDFLLT
jgi:hypothetical protein